MDRRAVVAAIESNFCDVIWSLRELPGVEVYEDEYVRWAITGVPYQLFNMVVRTAIPIDSADRIVGETTSRFRTRDVPMIWIVTSKSEPVDLAQRLEARGLTCATPTPGMAVDIVSLREPPAPPETEIQPVRRETQLDEFMDVFEKGFVLPEAATAAFAQLYHKQGGMQHRHYIAYERGRACAVSSLYWDGQIAGIYNVTTLPQARGRGHGAAVTFAALRDARSEGCSLGVLTSSKEAYNVYRRMGFEEYCKVSIYTSESKEL